MGEISSANVYDEQIISIIATEDHKNEETMKEQDQIRSTHESVSTDPKSPEVTEKNELNKNIENAISPGNNQDIQNISNIKYHYDQ